METKGRRYPLVEMITALSDEIREAQRRANEDPKQSVLQLKECSIELGIEWNKKAEGGLEFWVVKLGGGVSKTNTETIGVTLSPVGQIPVPQPG